MKKRVDGFCKFLDDQEAGSVAKSVAEDRHERDACQSDRHGLANGFAIKSAGLNAILAVPRISDFRLYVRLNALHPP